MYIYIYIYIHIYIYIYICMCALLRQRCVATRTGGCDSKASLRTPNVRFYTSRAPKCCVCVVLNAYVCADCAVATAMRRYALRERAVTTAMRHYVLVKCSISATRTERLRRDVSLYLYTRKNFLFLRHVPQNCGLTTAMRRYANGAVMTMRRYVLRMRTMLYFTTYTYNIIFLFLLLLHTPQNTTQRDGETSAVALAAHSREDYSEYYSR